ncbi:MAG: LysM peptidoglycan-binding domain-containing protein [Planctomycetaceae bacterium]|nr:LysM peptidoglycan-binding domain-containing protein [Planctomycetaceae bacterium]
MVVITILVFAFGFLVYRKVDLHQNGLQQANMGPRVSTSSEAGSDSVVPATPDDLQNTLAEFQTNRNTSQLTARNSVEDRMPDVDLSNLDLRDMTFGEEQIQQPSADFVVAPETTRSQFNNDPSIAEVQVEPAFDVPTENVPELVSVAEAVPSAEASLDVTASPEEDGPGSEMTDLFGQRISVSDEAGDATASGSQAIEEITEFLPAENGSQVEFGQGAVKSEMVPETDAFTEFVESPAPAPSNGLSVPDFGGFDQSIEPGSARLATTELPVVNAEEKENTLPDVAEEFGTASSEIALRPADNSVAVQGESETLFSFTDAASDSTEAAGPPSEELPGEELPGEMLIAMADPPKAGKNDDFFTPIVDETPPPPGPNQAKAAVEESVDPFFELDEPGQQAASSVPQSVTAPPAAVQESFDGGLFTQPSPSSQLQPPAASRTAPQGGFDLTPDRTAGGGPPVSPAQRRRVVQPGSQFSLAGYNYQRNGGDDRFDDVDCEVLEVRQNENYWALSKRAYGSSRYFSALAVFNQSRIPDPKKMRPGMKVLVPPAEVLEQRYPELFDDLTPRTPPVAEFFTTEDGRPAYRVGERETLSEISERLLGRSSRWIEIYRMNQTTLRDPNKLKAGMVLILPDDAVEVNVLP